MRTVHPGSAISWIYFEKNFKKSLGLTLHVSMAYGLREQNIKTYDQADNPSNRRKSLKE